MNLNDSLLPDDDDDSFLFRENLFLALNFLKDSDILNFEWFVYDFYFKPMTDDI